VKGFGPLFGMLADRVEALLADKGYDADSIREELAKADGEAVIPAKRATAAYRSRTTAKIPLAQSRRALVQQAQELASCRHPL
jgi:IS5 family transposase